MIESNATARQMLAELQATARAQFRFGKKAALINVDPQCTYMRQAHRYGFLSAGRSLLAAAND